ncbi:unnamed protein product [Rhizophagus irregularis]|uniref:RCC1/BLIP-II n=1 Tax=Rhizophagus irregularis TaxID=588596 RepID=A0A2N1MVX0_9GLOM|nr:RCC1/BLIP-II [Rhizophagus irregularis]CAB4378260.1 unnamed protein product [Rhizophagus irregularis]CAB5329051.1 unnamed protein product [Rhizophagus irregularis]
MPIIQSNKLFACGSNGNGQLGIGSFEDTNIPTACKFFITKQTEQQLESQEFQLSQKTFNSVLENLDTKPKVISGGGNHSAIITSFGELWMSGLNDDGQSGIASDSLKESKFNKVEILDEHEVRRWKYVTCGWNFSLAVEEENGCIYSFGKGVYGELGCGENVKKTGGRGVRIKGVEGVEKVVCGLRHVVCLNKEGKCFGWGSNKYGQLTKFDKDNNEKSHKKKKETLYFEPVRIFHDLNLRVINVACGQNHTVVLTSDGELYTFGLNKYGQLGYDFPNKIKFSDIPKKIDHESIGKVKSIHCGWNNTIIICDDDKLLIWGRNDHGQCGKNNPENENDVDGWMDKPVPLYYLPQNLILNEGFEIEECACGSEHTLIISKQGECLSWGWNEHGNCGIGDNENRWQPVKVRKAGNIKKVGGGCGNSWIWVQDG